MSDGAGKYERLMDSAIENVVRSFFDDYEKDNAEFRAQSGLPVEVIREEVGDCCDWCADLAGTYDYQDAPKEVWQRHAHCRCMVITRTARGTYQDAWSRKEYESQREARIAREEELVESQRKEQENNVANRSKAVEFRTERDYNKGAKRGALSDKNDPEGRRREDHAYRYYEEVRNSDKDSIVDKISENTGIDKDTVDKMFDHIFINEYDFGDGMERFDPDYDMAQSIQRLREGRNIQEHDLILVKHESLEYELMNIRGMSYPEAHEAANASYDYAKALAKWKGIE